jgi:hypothetical protein
MANALTAIKEITLPVYAERFAEAGFAALAIDDMFWGANGGEPRTKLSHMMCFKMFVMQSLGSLFNLKLIQLG